MKIKNWVIAAALTTALVSPTVMAAENGMTPAQKKNIEKIVHDYLVQHPEVLVEASQALQQKQQVEMQQKALSAITKNADTLFSDALTVAGNPKGNVTIVEFFDNQCIHCKKMSPIISGLIKKDPNLRVVYKEFPIFGKTSEMASKAALAAALQGKYQAMHEALLSQDKQLSNESIEEAAKAIGLDMGKLKVDMESKQVLDALAANRKLAEDMHLMGTPAFIIGATPAGQFKAGSQPAFVPGAASEQALEDLIKKVSGS